MNDQTTTIEELKDKMKTFAKERDWEQFHDAKNLSMAIAAEAAELMEHFMWLDKNQLSKKIEKDAQEIENEIADIFWFLLSLCNAYNIDLTSSAIHKLQINAKKYPVEKARGLAKKYNEY